jgi:DNA transformation protein and related proteins
MAASAEFQTYLADQFALFGSVQIRGMFGGLGIFRDGIMFGLVADEVVYLKSGLQNIEDFEREGMCPFTYEGKNKPVQMSYHQLPDFVLEDPEALSNWAHKAFAVAVQAKAKKPARKKKRKP